MKSFKFIKKVLSMALAFTFALSASGVGFAENTITARLYNTYGSDMLFQQNEPATLAGEAKSGSIIKAELINKNGTVIRNSETTAKSDNTFSLFFDAPAGGYDEYKIKVYCDDNVFAELSNVVFGELWLASGQSNMHIFLRYCKIGIDMVNNQETGTKNIRFLDMPLIPGYDADSGEIYVTGDSNSAGGFPLLPQKDIAGAEWFTGESTKIYDVSALAYFYAVKLQQDLDMPVGILCDYLGGSCIDAWLSREAIESDAEVKADLGSDYISSSKWNENGKYNNLGTMTALYNKKTAPLTNFRIAGMIWYQGESDCSNDYGVYSRKFELLQNSLTKDFNYQNGKLPVIFATFADNMLGGLTGFRVLGAELGEFAAADLSTRAAITISDLPLGYTEATQTCHPYEKKQVGERMAVSAESLVYKTTNCPASSPTLKSTEIKDGSVYLTFNDVGDGLVCTDKAIHGFTICGKNGVYVPADAEIVSKDTVRVYSENVPSPVAVMYSQGLITSRSNLYSSVDGEKHLPVCHTISDRDYVDNIWQDCGWTDCDQSKIWHCESLTLADFYNIWEVRDCFIEFSSAAAYSGDGGLNITADKGTFSVNPATTKYEPDTGNVTSFYNWEGIFKNFSSISVMLKNDGTKDVTLDGIKFYVKENKYYVPTVTGENTTSVTIPADGKWHKYAFSLDDLYKNGKQSFLTFTRKNLTGVDNIYFEFSSEDNANICLDDIRFTPYENAVSSFRIFGFDLITFISSLFSK